MHSKSSNPSTSQQKPTQKQSCQKSGRCRLTAASPRGARGPGGRTAALPRVFTSPDRQDSRLRQGNGKFFPSAAGTSRAENQLHDAAAVPQHARLAQRARRSQRDRRRDVSTQKKADLGTKGKKSLQNYCTISCNKCQDFKSDVSPH